MWYDHPLGIGSGERIMATSDHLKGLLRAFSKRDDETFLNVAQALIMEEQQKGHALLAKDLHRILNNGNTTQAQPATAPMVNDVPMDKERGLPLAHVERPDFTWDRLVLSAEIEGTLKSVVEEFRKREVFSTFGISAKRKLLFFGPPGCGKTITARVMAGVLDVPLLYVRFDSVVSSYLGETAANLRKVFDFAHRGHWVVLFDEFDAIGKGRDNPFEHGELKRVVNTLLQLMDGFAGESLLIAATNHHTLLDNAVWRRFDEICRFDPPTVEERERLVLRFCSSFRHPGLDVKKLARQMLKMTGDDIERVCTDAIKSAILDARIELSDADLLLGLSRQKHRMKLALVETARHPR